MTRAFDRRLLLVGLGGGLLSGLLGVGGGLVMIPLLVLWLGYDQKRAHAMSLGAIVPIAVGGIAAWAASGEVRWDAAGSLAAGATVGAFVGAGLLRRIPERALVAVFGVFLLLVAASTLLLHADEGEPVLGDAALLAASVPFGWLVGVAAALLGVGGGLFMVPWLVLLGGFTQHEAEATSIVVILPTAIVATARLARTGFDGTRDALLTGVVGALGGVVGTQAALALPGGALKTVFAIFITIVAVRLLRDARRT